MAIVQELSPRDCVKRLNVGKKMEAVLEQNDDLILFITDEAHFKLNNRVNRQNGLKTINMAKAEYGIPLQSPEVTAVARTGVNNPYFFQDDNVNTITVTSKHYRHMINENQN